jgi:hypothetical protein
MERPASLSPSSSATCVVSATRWLLVVDSAAIRFCAADHPGVVCTDSPAVTTTGGLSPRVVSACAWRNRSGMLANSSRALRQPRGLLSNAATGPAAGSGRLDQVAVGTSCPMPSRATLGNTATQLGALERVEPTVPVTW